MKLKMKLYTRLRRLLNIPTNSAEFFEQEQKRGQKNIDVVVETVAKEHDDFTYETYHAEISLSSPRRKLIIANSMVYPFQLPIQEELIGLYISRLKDAAESRGLNINIIGYSQKLMPYNQERHDELVDKIKYDPFG